MVINNIQDIFILDVETKFLPKEVKNSWNNQYGMGFGSAVVYEYKNDIYHFFAQDEKSEMVKLLNKSNNIIVSYNGKKFDNYVIFKNGNPLWKDIDILEEIVKSRYNTKNINQAIQIYGKNIIHNEVLNLNGVSYGTLNKNKNGSGELAPILLRKKKISKLYEYNLQDVRILRQLFEFLIKNKYVNDANGLKIEIDIMVKL
jgi:hypothetical protein